MGASDNLRFSCQCGTVSGVVEEAHPTEGDHVVCCCSDCRDLVRLFAKEARLLDKFGGTPLYQSRCARMRLHSGKEHLACLHMTSKPTTRWYASCCGTPMFNSYRNGRLPYITTLLGNCEPVKVAELLGPPVGYLFTDEASNDTGDLPKMSMARLMRRFLKRMLKDILSGERRRSELFDPQTLEPIAQPRLLTEAEQRALGRA